MQQRMWYVCSKYARALTATAWRLVGNDGQSTHTDIQKLEMNLFLHLSPLAIFWDSFDDALHCTQKCLMCLYYTSCVVQKSRRPSSPIQAPNSQSFESFDVCVYSIQLRHTAGVPIRNLLSVHMHWKLAVRELAACGHHSTPELSTNDAPSSLLW